MWKEVGEERQKTWERVEGGMQCTEKTNMNDINHKHEPLTGIRVSGMPSAAARKMQTTSPMLEDTM